MGKRVLIVDDQEDVRLMLRTMLEMRGWTVEEAHMGSQALQYGNDAELDAVVLDHRMPGILGSEVAQGMRAMGYKGVILLYSAFLTPDLEAQGESMGFVPVPKGGEVDLVQLLDRLTEPETAG